MLQRTQNSYVPSRMEHSKGAKVRPLIREKNKGIPWSRWLPSVWVTVAGMGYVAIGMVVQYADPTSGWLDTGMLSLPLFAAWSALLGYGIAGLLPVMYRTIGKKGGMKRWNENVRVTAMLVAYVGYIALLCTLL